MNRLRSVLIKSAGFPEQNIFTLSSDDSDEHKKPTVTNIVRLLGQELRPKLPGGLLLVAFSGHGINKLFKDGSRSESVPLLLMYDSSLSPDYLLERFSLPVKTLMEMLETTNASQILLFVDACQDDPDPSKPISDNFITTEFISKMQLRAQRFDGSLVFFATRPPLRAYVDPRDRGYFSEVVAEAFEGNAENGQNKYTTLDHFINYVQATVVSETHGKQNPKADPKGYNAQNFKIVDNTVDTASLPGAWHKIVVRHTGTESACAKLPHDAKVVVTVGNLTSTLEPGTGCEVQYFWPDSLAGTVAYVTLTSARGVVVDNSSRPQNRATATWDLDVHYSGPAVRISQFDINLGTLTGKGFDYRRLLNEQVLILSGLLSAQEETEYTNRLTLVDTGKAANPPLADQLEYLDSTNSVESLWGEESSEVNGAPELRLHVLVRPGPSVSALVTATFSLSDSAIAYQNVGEVTKALILLGLWEDANKRNNEQVAQLFSNRMLQILDHTDRLEEISPDLVSIKHMLEVKQRTAQ